MTNPFSWDYLNSVPPSNNVIDGWSMISLIIFGAGFLLASAVYYRPGLPFLMGRFKRSRVQFAAGVGCWIFGLGLFFFLVELLQIDPFTFGRRIWMFLMLLAAIVYILYMIVRWYQKSSDLKTAPLVTTTGSGMAVRTTSPHRRPVKRRRRV